MNLHLQPPKLFSTQLLPCIGDALQRIAGTVKAQTEFKSQPYSIKKFDTRYYPSTEEPLLQKAAHLVRNIRNRHILRTQPKEFNDLYLLATLIETKSKLSQDDYELIYEYVQRNEPWILDVLEEYHSQIESQIPISSIRHYSGNIDSYTAGIRALFSLMHLYEDYSGQAGRLGQIIRDRDNDVYDLSNDIEPVHSSTAREYVVSKRKSRIMRFASAVRSK